MRKMGRGQRGIHPEIWARWGEIVGTDLGKRIFPRRLKGRLLVISVSSSAWMQEMSYLKAALIEKIGQAAGPEIVTDIKFTLDTSLTTAPRRSEPPPPPPKNDAPPLSLKIDSVVNSIENDELRDTIRRAVNANFKPE